ncbi:hypothetical protein D3C76_380010 [compost metagenome]
MHCNLRKPLLNSTKYICIIAERKIWVRTALHQDFCTIYSDGLRDFLVDRFIWQYIALIRARSAVKCTETTVNITYIRIVNITTNYKCGHRVRMPTFHYGVCCSTHFLNFVTLEQSDGIFQLKTFPP